MLRGARSNGIRNQRLYHPGKIKAVFAAYNLTLINSYAFKNCPARVYATGKQLL